MADKSEMITHSKSLSTSEFERLCNEDFSTFKIFLDNKVQIEEGEYAVYRGSLDARDEIYKDCSESWKASIRKLNTNVAKVLYFAKNNCRNFYYFNHDTLTLYFQDKSDMDLMFLKFKLLS